MNIAFLRVPLHKLLYIQDVEGFNGLTEKELQSFRKDYSAEEAENIKESVAWAIKHPEYDFASLLPGLKQSNEDIYKYLCKIAASLGVS